MLCYIPTIVFHFSLIPLWNGNTAMVTKAASYSGARTMFFVPIYSLIINYILSEKFKVFSIILIASVIFTNIFLSSYLNTVNYENLIGRSYESDRESEGVYTLEKIVGIIISSFGLLIMYFNQREKFKKLP